jgi:hypothetical protein
MGITAEPAAFTAGISPDRLPAPVLSEDRTDRLADAVLSLAAAPNLAGLMRLAAPTVGARLAGG